MVATLSEFQHGFRPGYSCQTQLIDFIENIQHVMDQQNQVDLTLLDFSEAFDIFPHQRLLTKLAHYGIQGDAHRWIRSWVTLCTQRVVIATWRNIQFCKGNVWSTTKNC